MHIEKVCSLKEIINDARKQILRAASPIGVTDDLIREIYGVCKNYCIPWENRAITYCTLAGLAGFASTLVTVYVGKVSSNAALVFAISGVVLLSVMIILIYLKKRSVGRIVNKIVPELMNITYRLTEEKTEKNARNLINRITYLPDPSQTWTSIGPVEWTQHGKAVKFTNRETGLTEHVSGDIRVTELQTQQGD